MSHISGPAFALLFVLAALVAAVVIAAGPGKRGAGRRLIACLIGGVILGGALVEWIWEARRRVVTDQAASAHMSAANLRADGLIGTAVVVAVILFAVTTAAQRSASARGRSRTRELPAARARRRAGTVRWP